MSSTPPKSTLKTPSKQWFHILFGRSAADETSPGHVEASTDFTDARRSSSNLKNLQKVNLEDTYDMEGIVIRSSGFSSPVAAVSGLSVKTTLPSQQLKERTTPADQSMSGKLPPQISAIQGVTKSPWRSSHTVKFNVPGMGRSEPEPSRGTNRGHGSIYATTNIVPVTHKKKRIRNKYKTSLSMGIPQKRRNRGTSAIGIDVRAVLMNARSAIEPSNQKIQSDNNFRNNIVCRPGLQLLPHNQRRASGRLPEQQPENSNGKRDIANNDQSNMEVARKKRKVGFSESMPIENLVSTPSRTSKRKATPHKSEAQERNIDHDEEMRGASKLSTISRDLVKAKRPASKTTTKKSCNDDEKEESFSSMPDTKDNLIRDYTIWSEPDEREMLGEAITGDIVAPHCFMLKPSVSPSDIPIYKPTLSLPQFRQKPLAERMDKRVPDEDDDCEAIQDKKTIEGRNLEMRGVRI